MLLPGSAPIKADTEYIDFTDNRLVQGLAGEHDTHLVIIEKAFDVRIDPRGNRFAVTGSKTARAGAIAAMQSVYARLVKGELIGIGDIRAATRLTLPATDTAHPDHLAVKTPRRLIKPRSPNQSRYLEALQANDLTFGTGPAGTGKTYLAVAHVVSLLLSGSVERLILTRPALEAGERIGFLPGDMKEKIDPYLRPLYDALYDMLDTDFVERRIAAGDIEIAPLGFMRGRTFARAAVILDEGQNATVAQMKMFLTRLGEGSTMVVTGDASQTDLSPGTPSGLNDALNILGNVEGVGHTAFTTGDVVRHPLVARILEAYDANEKTAKP